MRKYHLKPIPHPNYLHFLKCILRDMGALVCYLLSDFLFFNSKHDSQKTQALKTHTVVQPAFNAPMGPLHLLKLRSELRNNLHFPPHCPGIYSLNGNTLAI